MATSPLSAICMLGSASPTAILVAFSLHLEKQRKRVDDDESGTRFSHCLSERRSVVNNESVDVGTLENVDEIRIPCGSIKTPTNGVVRSVLC